MWRKFPEFRNETFDEVTRYIRKGPTARVRSVYDFHGIDPGVSMSISPMDLLELGGGVPVAGPVVKEIIFVKVCVNRVSIPSAESLEVGGGGLGLLAILAGRVNERRTVGVDCVDGALSAVAGKAGEDMMQS